MDSRLMECGHIAHSKDGNFYCVMCDCSTEWTKSLSLNNRKMRCIYCSHEISSNIKAPFFKHSTDREYDLYYCGCRGWD